MEIACDSQGVLRVVPTNPPTVPAIRLLPSSPCLVWVAWVTILPKSFREDTYSRFRQETPHPKDRPKISTIPPPMSPKRTLHPLIQTGNRSEYALSLGARDSLPEWSRCPERVPNDIQWTFECRALILKTDLDQLERRDHDGFGRTGKTSGEDGERLRVLGLTVRGEDSAPPSCGKEISAPRSVTGRADGAHHWLRLYDTRTVVS